MLFADLVLSRQGNFFVADYLVFVDYCYNFVVVYNDFFRQNEEFVHIFASMLLLYRIKRLARHDGLFA